MIRFISFVIALLHLVLTLYTYVIIARAVISWLNPNRYHPIVRFIYNITEPLLGRVRKILPPISGLDLSPVLVILAVYLIDRFLVSTLRSLLYLN